MAMEGVAIEPSTCAGDQHQRRGEAQSVPVIARADRREHLGDGLPALLGQERIEQFAEAPGMLGQTLQIFLGRGLATARAPCATSPLPGGSRLSRTPPPER